MAQGRDRELVALLTHCLATPSPAFFTRCEARSSAHSAMGPRRLGAMFSASPAPAASHTQARPASPPGHPSCQPATCRSRMRFSRLSANWHPSRTASNRTSSAHMVSMADASALRARGSAGGAGARRRARRPCSTSRRRRPARRGPGGRPRPPAAARGPTRGRRRGPACRPAPPRTAAAPCTACGAELTSRSGTVSACVPCVAPSQPARMLA
jgi:hypothetical protein